MQHMTDGCLCEGKVCKKCQELKCLKEFARDKAPLRRCKECENRRKREWLDAHPEKRQEYNEKQKQYDGMRGKSVERKTAKRESNREWKKRTGYKAHLAIPIEARREYRKKWEKQNYERYRELQRKGAHIRRARISGTGGKFTIHEWDTLLETYDYACLRCGRKPPEIHLSADHIIPLAKGGTSDISNIQPLCRQCNNWKRAKTLDFRPLKT